MTQPPMPPQPTTKELPAPDKNEILLAELKVLMIQGMGALDAKVAIGFKTMGADIAVIASAVDVLKDRVSLHDKRFEEHDARLNSSSIRAKAVSQHDIETDAKTTKLEEAVDDIKQKIDTAAIVQTSAIVEGVKAAIKNPLIKKIGYAAGVLLLQALATATTYLSLRGH